MALVPFGSMPFCGDEFNRGEGEGDDGRRTDSWVASSMQKVEHFLETRKFGNFISPPTNLGECGKNMLVEQMMITAKVKEVAELLRQEYLEENRSGSGDTSFHFKKPSSSQEEPVRVFGRASRGDKFFQDKPEEDKHRRDSPSTKKRRTEGQPRANTFSPSVMDYFSDEDILSTMKREKTANREEAKKRTPKKGQKAQPEVGKDFPNPNLGEFIRCGVDPIRIPDKKYQMKDDAMNAFLSERAGRGINPQSPDHIDKSLQFVIELTFYVKISEETYGFEVCPTANNACYKVEVLGNQTLANLRDALTCDNDYVYLKEVSHPDDLQDSSNLAKNNVQSAMLLIDNTIYNDMRSPTKFDYAEQIIRWSQQTPSKKIGPFNRGDMSCTKLEDLTVQFGYPYLFRHMGNCEHIVVFNKARLLSSDDELRASFYPRIPWTSHTFPKLCRVDNEFLATWAVLDYEELPENPMLLCTECLKQFCYTNSGSKRGSFRVFPYRQWICEIPLPSEKVSTS